MPRRSNPKETARAGWYFTGEIKAVFPGKAVTFVSVQARLFPMYSKKLHKKPVELLSALGIALHLGQTASGLARNDRPCEGEITLPDGTRPAGLIAPGHWHKAGQ